MSTTAVPGHYGLERKQVAPSTERLQPTQVPAKTGIRRRGSAIQGQALETLGHAIEYLIDTHPFLPFEELAGEQADVRDAIHLLMQSSRAVFAECPEVLTFRQRISQRFLKRSRRAPAMHS